MSIDGKTRRRASTPGMGNSPHGCLEAIFGDELMRAPRADEAAHDVVLRRLGRNLLRPDPIRRMGNVDARRLQ